MLAKLAAWVMRNRAKLPRWVNRLMESAAKNPSGLLGRLAGVALGGGKASAPNTAVPERQFRVYIAPTNYAGQGYLWARALETADQRVGARNQAIELPGSLSFAADTPVPIAVVNASAEWAEAEWEAARQFTHVLVEAGRPMFGRQFRHSVRDEIAALRDAGVSVAYLAHGTDVRLPSKHRELTRYSPFPEDPNTEQQQAEASRNLQFIADLELPVFISTPDLWSFLPDAHWCPVVADVSRFVGTGSKLRFGVGAVGEQPPLRIIHSSTNQMQKGSGWLEPALRPLLEAGKAEYRLITGTPAAEMPAVVGAADVVLDQFRLGSYGAAACEAMAAGRVVLGHVLPEVRERIVQSCGLQLPIVEAVPETLEEQLRSLLTEPERALELAAAGPEFVAVVHSGSMSARSLLDNWILKGD